MSEIERIENGEMEQCLNCLHIWDHIDDRCPECGHEYTEQFDPKVKIKELQSDHRQQLEEDLVKFATKCLRFKAQYGHCPVLNLKDEFIQSKLQDDE